MKKIVFIIFIIFLGIFFVGSIYAKEKLPMKGKTIFLDAGHGGLDPGTLFDNIYEKDINLKITLYLRDYLKKLGAEVYLTREGDYDLSKPNARYRKKSDFDNRIKAINSKGADLYISIHLNYLLDSKYYGAQVFYNEKFEENQKLANNLQIAFNKELKIEREIKNIPSATYMYSKLNIPGVLIECGFLSNPNERDLLNSKSYQEKLAKIIGDVLKVF